MAITIKIHNTATRNVEDFEPLSPGEVRMYHCGPTVYDYAHIGNLRAYITADILRRMFEASGYHVNQVTNITDVGHLTGDADEGEDKIELGAKREKKSVEDIIRLYTDAFLDDLRALNILLPHQLPRASEHIPEQIALIETLEKKGHTYRTSDGIYFDASTFARYADFARLDLSGLKSGARVEESKEKRNPYDFALWKFSPEGEQRLQEWESPWGRGFPGWHLECSAMSMKYLGSTFDIHTGGIDHIPVHHTNEIAQSECATDKTFSRYWMHTAFMTVDGEKMSKSLRNTFLLRDLGGRGITPAAFRYWILQAKYRSPINFTWEALLGAEKAVQHLALTLSSVDRKQKKDSPPPPPVLEAMRNDLDTPAMLALLRDMSQEEQYSVLDLLGIDLSWHMEKIQESQKGPIPEDIQKMKAERDLARKAGNWEESDRLREAIQKEGFVVEDTSEGTTITRKIFT